MNEDDIRRAMAGQQRHFDNQLSDFRQFYESFPPGERAKIKAWLEKVEAVGREGLEFNMLLNVKVENDECDERGTVLRWADCQFSPMTLLAAIRAWDAGEDFAPPGVLP